MGESGELMDWFKCLGQYSPAMDAVKEAFGWPGYGMACAFLEVAIEQEAEEVTIAQLCRWLKIQKPKAIKMLPLFNQILAEFWAKSEQKVSKKYALNPRGSTCDRKKERENREKETSSSPYPSFAPIDLTEEEEEALFQNTDKATNNQLLRTTVAAKSPVPQATPTSSPEVNINGVFTGKYTPFSIKRNGQTSTEYDWILTALHEHHKRANTGLTLDAFLSLYPSAQKTFHRWMSKPMSLRMAAFAKTMKESNAKFELSYALAVADKSSYDLNILSDYLGFFDKAVENSDYEVEFNDG